MRLPLLLALLTACGADRVVDFGAPSDVYPNAPPPVSAVQRGAGTALPSVHVVPIFFADDPLRDVVPRFLADYAASPYWAQQVGEYGVGALSVAPAVVLADPAPATADPASLHAIVTQLADATADTAALATTVFAVHYPARTSFNAPLGRSCEAFAGFHDQIARGSGHLYLAAIFACDHAFGLTSPEDIVTTVLTHELVEAATDPLADNSGWAAPNPLAVPYSIVGGGAELGDACFVDPPARPDGFGHTIARTWSNAAAAAFQDPCVPAPAGPYFAAVPEAPDTGFVPVSFVDVPAALVSVPVGEARTITVDLLSSGPTPDWTIEVREHSTRGELALSLDRATGRNGNQVHLTIRRVASPVDDVSLFELRSTSDGRTTVTLGLAGS